MNGPYEFPMTHPVLVTHPVPVTSRAGDTYPSRARSDRREVQVPERPQFASHYCTHTKFYISSETGVGFRYVVAQEPIASMTARVLTLSLLPRRQSSRLAAKLRSVSILHSPETNCKPQNLFEQLPTDLKTSHPV